MQEVNQLACEEIWPDEELPGICALPWLFSSRAERKSCGKACRAFERIPGFPIPGPGSWQSWAMTATTKAWLSSAYRPSRIRTSFRSAAPSDYHYWKTRRALWHPLRRQIRTPGFTPFIWAWWDDAEDPFAGQWEQLNQLPAGKGQAGHAGKMSGFWEILTARRRCPARAMTASGKTGWLDSYVLAAQEG